MKRLIAITVALGTAFSANAAPTDNAMFTITMDGRPIGTHAFTFSKSGDDLKVDVLTHSDVKILFLHITYDHQRTEAWRGGRLQSLMSKTDDDGTAHQADMQANGSELNIKADGKTFSLPGDALVVTLWNQDILKRDTLYSALDGQTYKVKIEPKGTEEITVGGRKIVASVYDMKGGLERKLWYGPDGTFLKTAFRRRGYDIEWVRN